MTFQISHNDFLAFIEVQQNLVKLLKDVVVEGYAKVDQLETDLIAAQTELHDTKIELARLREKSSRLESYISG